MGAEKKLIYLLNADFSKYADTAAPLDNPLSALPGPGSLDITDAESQGVYISDGKIVFPNTGSGVGGSSGYKIQSTVRTSPPVCALVTLKSGAGNIYLCNCSGFHPLFSSGIDGFIRIATVNTVLPHTPVASDKISPIYISNHMFVVISGVLYIIEARASSALYPWFYYSYNNGGEAVSFSKMQLLDLSTQGYPKLSSDYSEVTDSLSAPSSGVSFNHDVDCEVSYSFTYEAGQSINIYLQYTDSNNRIYLYSGGTGIFYIVKKVDGATIYLHTETGVFSDGVVYQISAIIEDNFLRVCLNGVEKLAAGDVSDLPVSTIGISNDTLATNDIELETHPYPALGPATSRLVCPQAGDTQAMNPDSFIELKGIILPATSSSYYFRYTDSNNNLKLTINSDGSLTLDDYVAGVSTTRISLGAGGVVDADDLTIHINGTDGALWVNGGTPTTTSAIATLTGSSAVSDAAAPLLCDSCTIWPVDWVTAKLIPGELS